MENIVECKTFSSKYGEVDYFEEDGKVYLKGIHVCKILNIPYPAVNIRYYCKDVIKRTVSKSKGKKEVLFIGIEGVDVLIKKSKQGYKEEFRNELKELMGEESQMDEPVLEIVEEDKSQKEDIENKENNYMNDYNEDKEPQITKLNVFFKAEVKEYVVDSREAAKMVGKDHAHLMRDIAGYVKIIEASSQSKSGLADNPYKAFRSLDFFIPSTYKDAQDKPRPYYLLTKKGCDMVANKMTGEKGVLFTAAYVTAFEDMREHIEKEELQAPRIHVNIENIDSNLLRKLANAIDERKACEVMLKDLVAQEEKLKKEIFGNQPFNTSSSVYCCNVKRSPYVRASISSIAKNYNLTGSELNSLLAEYNIQHKEGAVWVINDEYKDKGYSETIDRDEYTFMMWTKEGQIFLYQILREHGILPMIERV